MSSRADVFSLRLSHSTWWYLGTADTQWIDTIVILGRIVVLLHTVTGGIAVQVLGDSLWFVLVCMFYVLYDL